jgi:diguanylate cyclase (GGDEF)-like protein
MVNALKKTSNGVKLHPYIEATKIAALYGLLGIFWIAFPDEILSHIINDTSTFKQISMYKGWTYVGITVLLIFFLVFKRLLIFEEALVEVENSYSKQKEVEKKLNLLAYYDTLTGLPNRRCFEERVKKLIACEGKKFALVYMDVDNFKNINDTLGHLTGDKFLIHMADVLNNSIHSKDFVARLGGDEFAIVFEDIQQEEEVVNKIQHLLRLIQKPWKIDGHQFFVSLSIGIVLYPKQGDNLSTLLKNSDIAMYHIKKKSKNNYCFFSEELKEKNIQQITMINDLHRAIQNKEFKLVYQPIVELKTGKLNGVEALIRWVNPEKGIISPIEFIPVAEETGLIHDIGKFVLNNAFWQKNQWEQLGYHHLKMSINVSGQSLIREGFVEHIRKLLEQTGIDSSEIQLEITETVLIEKMEESKRVLHELSIMGFKIALDDFGTGYSSLTYLKNLPIDVVKLDRDFVKGIMEKGEDSVIVESVIKLTHDLNLQIVAEGIEYEEQLSILKCNSCDFGQGYLFSKPVADSVIIEMLKGSTKQTG